MTVDPLTGKIKRGCGECHGVGYMPDGSVCQKCAGTGKQKRGAKKCKFCHGTGAIVNKLNPAETTCPKCGGTGKKPRRKKVNALVIEQDISPTVEVGEFASELTAAMCYRERTGLPEGDWLDDPVRGYTDGNAFAEEVRRTTQNTFQVTVSLDVSGSMYGNDSTMYARIANPMFYSFNLAMQESLRCLPEGMLLYAPFVFSSDSYRCPQSYMQYYKRVVLKSVWGRSVSVKFPPQHLYNPYYTTSPGEEAEQRKAIEDAAKELGIKDLEEVPRAIYGGGTHIGSLLKAIQTWELEQGDIATTKLDIVVTDGGIGGSDYLDSCRIQAERTAGGARLQTILLNVAGSEHWSRRMPDSMVEYKVTIDALTSQVRNVLMDTIQEITR